MIILAPDYLSVIQHMRSSLLDRSLVAVVVEDIKTLTVVISLVNFSHVTRIPGVLDNMNTLFFIGWRACMAARRCSYLYRIRARESSDWCLTPTISAAAHVDFSLVVLIEC